MGNLRRVRRKLGAGKEKNESVSRTGEEKSDDIYKIPAEVWNNWNYETKFKVRKIIEDESLTHTECIAMIEQFVNDSVGSGNKKMEETGLFARLTKQ